MDTGKTLWGVEKQDRQAAYDGDDNYVPASLTCLRDAWNELKNHLAPQWRLVPNVTGWCGLDVYRLTDMDQYHGGQRAYKNIPPDDGMFAQFLEEVRGALQSMMEETGKKDPKVRHITQLYEDLTSGRPNSPSYYICSTGQPPAFKSTTAGTGGALRTVPTLDTFPAALQALDARDLLRLLPDAEASTLMLLLGRTLAGPSGTLLDGAAIEHKWRSYGILVGFEPGLGKSTLLEFITKGLKACNYATETIDTSFGRFGWGRIARSDMSIIDDLTSDSQAKMLADPRVKTLVSNGELLTEEKGIAGQTVKARCTILAASNSCDLRDFFRVDPGAISRVNLLYTYNRHELTERWGPGEHGTYEHWNTLADKYDVSLEVLALYLLRRSVDLFLEVAGYAYDGSRLERVGPCQLRETMEANRALYVLETDVRHGDQLLEATAQVVALAVARSDYTEELLESAQRCLYGPELLTGVLRVFCHCPDLQGDLASLNLQGMPPEMRSWISARLAEFGNHKGTLNFEKSFSAITSELKGRQGINYPTLGWLNAKWAGVARSIPGLVAEWQQTRPKCDGRLNSILGFVENHLTSS